MLLTRQIHSIRLLADFTKRYGKNDNARNAADPVEESTQHPKSRRFVNIAQHKRQVQQCAHFRLDDVQNGWRRQNGEQRRTIRGTILRDIIEC